MYSTLKHQPCLVLLLFLSSSPLALAQPGGFPGPGPPPPPPPPPPPQNIYSLGQSFSPTMAIVMVVLITAFFVLGFFSVYVRQCLDRRYHSVQGGRPTPADPAGGPQWGRRGPVGLDASVIDSFPTFLYSAVKGLKLGEVSLECAVCLNEFEDNETLRLIPKCSHVFHPDCIDEWLASHVTCPVCRANLTPRPGELPFTRVEIGELDDGSVGPADRTGEQNSENCVAGEVCIPIDHDGRRPVPHETQSHETNVLYLAHENRTIRSWSNGWLLREMLFPRSNSTGHSLVQQGENLDRFTLRLPVEVRSQIMETARMNRTKSSTVFPRVRSTRKGYRRMASVGSWRARNYFNYERFNIPDQSDPTDSGVNQVSLPQTGPVGSDVVLGACENPVSAAPTKNFQRSARSLHLSHTKAEGQDGEGSFDWRRSKSTHVRMVADP